MASLCWILLYILVISSSQGKKSYKNCTSVGWKRHIEECLPDKNCTHCKPCVDFKDKQWYYDTGGNCSKQQDDEVNGRAEFCGVLRHKIFYQCAKYDLETENHYSHRSDCDVAENRQCDWSNCGKCINCDGAVKPKCYIYGIGRCGSDEIDEIVNDSPPPLEKKVKIVKDCKLPQDKKSVYTSVICPQNIEDVGLAFVLITTPMSREDASNYCLDTYGSKMSSLLTPLDFYDAKLMLNFSGIDKANIGLQSTHRGGWWEFDDETCCDDTYNPNNAYGTCVDGNRWKQGEPMPNCDQHPGTSSASIDTDGLINNDISGDEEMPFFCNCPLREINRCSNNNGAKVIDLSLELDNAMEDSTNIYSYYAILILSLNVIISGAFTMFILCCIYYYCLRNKNKKVMDPDKISI